MAATEKPAGVLVIPASGYEKVGEVMVPKVWKGTRYAPQPEPKAQPKAQPDKG